MKLLFCFLFLPLLVRAQVHLDQRQMAVDCLATLDSAQKAQALFAFDDMYRYDWNYLPASLIPRRGLCTKDLQPAQKQKVLELLKAFTSQRGYDRAQAIIQNEAYLKEIEPNNIHRIPENYYITFFGNPAQDSIWGWKFSGHHLALNYTLVNNQLAFTPVFFGVYPAQVTQGKNAGRRIIKEEEDLGFALVNSFTAAQKAKAVFMAKAYYEVVTSNATQVAPLAPVGITAKEMDPAQHAALQQLLATHLSSMPPSLAEKRLKRLMAEDFSQVRFGWAGGLQPGTAHYYRIQGKSFLVELDNTSHNANHVHIVWRDFNGDFGADLLKEHYQKAAHHHTKKKQP